MTISSIICKDYVSVTTWKSNFNSFMTVVPINQLTGFYIIKTSVMKELIFKYIKPQNGQTPHNKLSKIFKACQHFMTLCVKR